MQPQRLFFDNENDALIAAINSAGGFKKVAHAIWPARKLDSAYARLKNCVKEDGDERLTFAEIVKIGQLARAQGCHALMQYLGTELGYDCKPVEPEDEKAVLQREFIDAVNRAQDMTDRLQALHQRLAVVR